MFDVASASGGLSGIRGLDARTGEMRFTHALDPWCGPVVVADGVIAVGARGTRGRDVVRIRADGTILGRDAVWMNQGEDALTYSRFALRTLDMEADTFQAELQPLGGRMPGYLLRLGTVFQIRDAEGETLREEGFLRSPILAAGEGAVLAQCWRSQPQKTMLELFSADRGRWRRSLTFVPTGSEHTVVLSRPRVPANAAWIAGGVLVELDDEAQRRWISGSLPSEEAFAAEDVEQPPPPSPGSRPKRPPAELWIHSIESGAMLQRAAIDGEVTAVAATPHVIAALTAGSDAAIHCWSADGTPLGRFALGARSAARNASPAFACADDVHLLWASGETLVCSLLASPGETVWTLDSPIRFRGPAPMVDAGLSFVHAAATDGALVLTGDTELCGFLESPDASR